jgi:predicted ATP-grasp superfamily ATP-dependent carboligase
MFKFIKEEHSLKNKIILICGISAGYVPTYAIDTIIVDNKFERIAYYETSLLEPSIGYLPNNIESGALGLPAELYELGDVLLLQFRSTVRFGRKK